MSKRRRTVVWQDFQYKYPVWQLEQIFMSGRSSLTSSASAWGRPSSSSCSSMTKRVKKTPYLNQDRCNQAVRDAIEISRWRALPQGSGMDKQAWRRRRSGLTEVSNPSSDANTPRRLIISNETRWCKTPQPKKQTNKTRWWNTPLQKSTQSSEHHRQST